MNALKQLFDYNGHAIRVHGSNENPLFVGNDVCLALGLKSRSTLKNLEDHLKGGQTLATLGGDQSLTMITEAGVYRLIFRSYKPAAQAFQKWVFEEVLPAIRKTGRYDLHGLDLAEMYRTARTGMAQVEVIGLLREVMGIHKAVAITPPTAVRAALALDLDQLWQDIADLIGTDSGSFRLLSDGPEQARLYFAPARVLPRLQELERYQSAQWADFRAALMRTPGWIAGRNRQRFGADTEHCYGFACAPAAELPAGLLDAVEKLKPSPALN